MTDATHTWGAPTLAGRLIRLEPLAPEHEAGLWDASRDGRTWRWMPITRPETRDDLRTWLEAALDAQARGAELPLVTISYKDGVVGSTRYLALRPEHRSVEIGWTWLHPRVWGSGVNVEAKLLQLAHAFDTWRCRRVELKTDASNERSRRAIEAIGASFEGVHRKHMLVRGGESRDTAWYALTDDEWPAARRLLEDRLAARD
jgi:RimJ/RimL family protein N-acetyltransferase